VHVCVCTCMCVRQTCPLEKHGQCYVRVDVCVYACVCVCPTGPCGNHGQYHVLYKYMCVHVCVCVWFRLVRVASMVSSGCTRVSV